MKIIKIGAIWCPACLIMNSRINKICTKYNIELIEYDYDIDEEKVKEYNVGKILPVLIFINNEKEINRLIGEVSEKQLENIINKG